MSQSDTHANTNFHLSFPFLHDEKCWNKSALLQSCQYLITSHWDEHSKCIGGCFCSVFPQESHPLCSHFRPLKLFNCMVKSHICLGCKLQILQPRLHALAVCTEIFEKNLPKIALLRGTEL